MLTMAMLVCLDIYFDDSSNKLSPNKYFEKEVLVYLLKSKLIFLISISFNKASSIKREEDLENLDLFSCHYCLEIKGVELNQDNIYQLLYYPKIKWDSEYEIRNIWITIASAECLEYIIHKAEDIGIHYMYTHKHIQHIGDILQLFSVSQFFYMYFSSLKNASYNQIREGISSKQTLHKSLYNTLKHSERALAEGWLINTYNRGSGCNKVCLYDY
jgi:hypothetical protein